MALSLGTVRSYWVAVIIFFCSFLNGYDSGVAGGILTYPSFLSDYGNYTDENRVDSLTVGLQQLGAFVACFVVYPAADRYGRKPAIIGSAIVFLIGTVIETINTGSLPAWYVARLIAGFGQGGCTVAVPTYCIEMSPKEIRGRLGSFYQWMYTWGVFLAYWVNYGVQKHVPGTQSKQWQIPVGLQLVSGAILLFGTLTLPESVRSLLQRKHYEKAWKSLTWIRGSDSEVVVAEFEDMKVGIAEEQAAQEGLSLRELISPTNRARFGLGMTIFMFQQATGSTALAYFGPQFFSLITNDSTSEDLLLTGLFGAVKVVGCSFFIIVISERFTRRTFMSGGGTVMGICMLITALLLRYEPPHKGSDIGPYGAAIVAMLFINIFFYNCSWGPIPWAYVPEIFNTRTRALGMAFSSGNHWLFSFVFNISTPYMITNLGWGTFLFYSMMDFIMAAFCWWFIKETKNKTLEQVQQELWMEKEGGAKIENDLYHTDSEGGVKKTEVAVENKEGSTPPEFNKS